MFASICLVLPDSVRILPAVSAFSSRREQIHAKFMQDAAFLCSVVYDRCKVKEQAHADGRTQAKTS